MTIYLTREIWMGTLLIWECPELEELLLQWVRKLFHCFHFVVFWAVRSGR